MPFPTASVLNSAGTPITINTLPNAGQDVKANSLPVTVASDQTLVVSGTITANAGTGTFAVSAASLPLPTGASTAANQTALNALFPASLGQKAMAASLAVVIASDQSALPASQSGTWNITNISGTISLPTGAATAANQSTLNTNIGSSADAVVANGVAGSIASYLRTIKDSATDTTTASPVSVRQPCDLVSLTPVLDTSIYAAGDTLFVATAMVAVSVNDERSLLQSVAVVDKDDQKPAMRLLFFKANVAFGTINAAPSISDADAASYLGHVDIAATDYVDLGGVSVACAKGINLLLESAAGTSNVYVAGMLTAGTPTHTASGLVLNFGLIFS